EALGRAVLSLPPQRLAADEGSAFVELDGMHQARLERRFVWAKLGAEGAATRLDPKCVDRVVAGVFEAKLRPGIAERGRDAGGELRGHVELEAGSANVAHAGRSGACETHVDLGRST